jgi:hypothetical protein
MHGEATTKTEAMSRRDIRGKIPTTQEQVATSAVTMVAVTMVVVTGVVVTGVAARGVISK